MKPCKVTVRFESSAFFQQNHVVRVGHFRKQEFQIWYYFSSPLRFTHVGWTMDETRVKGIEPLTPRVKPWVIQRFLTFDGHNRKVWPFIGKQLSSTLLWCCLLTLWLPEWNLGWWKAVKQYFTVVLFVNPLTPRVKPCVIQFSNFWFHVQNPKVWPFIGKLLSSTILWCCLLTLWTLKTPCTDHSLESCWVVLYCGAVC